MDSSLCFMSYISNVTRSAYFHICDINRLLPSLTPHSTAILFTYRINFCISILFDSLINPFICWLFRTLLTVSSPSSYNHIIPLLQQFHSLPLKSHINFKILLQTFWEPSTISPLHVTFCRSLPSLAPSDLPLPSTSQYLIPNSPVSTPWGSRTFCRSAPQLWNSLPSELQNTCFAVQNWLENTSL